MALSRVLASMVSFVQSGVGAIKRTLADKMREQVSVKDFGAVGDGATDDTAAIQAAIVAGAWNGWRIFFPKGSYRVKDSLYVGSYNGQSYSSAHLVGDTPYGVVLMRLQGDPGTGPIMYVDGHHHTIENLGFIGDKDGLGGWSASHAIKIRGYPQPGVLSTTKWCTFRNLHINRVGIGVQIGDYQVDGKDPDIETNSFHDIKIQNVFKCVYINGQNILHNPWYNSHFTEARDYLVHQERGGDAWFERCYFGPMFDYLGNNFNVPSIAKVYVTAGVLTMFGCRSECQSGAQGNTGSRPAVYVSSTDSRIIILQGNTFTTKDNLNSEPSIKIIGQGTGGAANVKASFLHNEFYGTVELDTLDFFSLGNTYRGTGNGTIGGKLFGTNQLNQTFREVLLDSNLEQTLPGVRISKSSSNMIKIERSVPAVDSEWLGNMFYDVAATFWGRIGMRAVALDAGQEASVLLLQSKFGGAANGIGITFGAAAPTLYGKYKRGDVVWNSAPAAGGPAFWVCVTAGTPGTWKAGPNLAA